jgi:quinol monooxygenase YgiN
MRDVTVSLVVRLNARQDAAEIAGFVTSFVAAADAESGTTVWLALRTDEQTFWIVDAFPTESDRRTHLDGPIAAALIENAERLLAAPPEILSAVRRLVLLVAEYPGATVHEPVARGSGPTEAAPRVRVRLPTLQARNWHPSSDGLEIVPRIKGKPQGGATAAPWGFPRRGLSH